LLYAELAHQGPEIGDNAWYHLIANAIGDGHGFNQSANPKDGGALFDFSDGTAPTAFHPPLFPAILALASKLGLTSWGAHRAVGCALGAATVAVVGWIGRRLGGRALGLTAAGLAAVYLPLIANDSSLMSESLFGLTIAAVVLAALRLAEAPSGPRAAVLGVAIGLAALTRAEALLLLFLLVPFAARRAGRQPLRYGLVAVAATVVVVAPWCIRNSLAFDRPVGITTGDGAAVAGSNTKYTFYGDRIGTWDFGGLAIAPRPGPYNEAIEDARLRRKGLNYARDHAGRLPLVASARVLRTWSVYPFDPDRKVRFTAFTEGRRVNVEWATLVSAWAVMVLAVIGAVALRRRGGWLGALVAPMALVTVVSLLFYGGVRFREAADVSLVVLAAAGILAIAARVSEALAARRSDAATFAA
jgi:hypothetical protein